MSNRINQIRQKKNELAGMIQARLSIYGTVSVPPGFSIDLANNWERPPPKGFTSIVPPDPFPETPWGSASFKNPRSIWFAGGWPSATLNPVPYNPTP